MAGHKHTTIIITDRHVVFKRQFVNRAKINNVLETYEKKRKEVSVSANDDSGPQKKRIKTRCSCSVGKCTNNAVKGDVCALGTGQR